MDSIWDLTRDFWGIVIAGVKRFLDESAYRDGFLSATVLLLGIGLIYGIFDDAFRRIRKFFEATKGPPMQAPGPSPVTMGSGCASGMFVVLGLGGLLLMLFLGLLLR